MSLAGVFSRAETFQSPVHAGGSYAQTHRREATQVHCECIIRLCLCTHFPLLLSETLSSQFLHLQEVNYQKQECCCLKCHILNLPFGLIFLYKALATTLNDL